MISYKNFLVTLICLISTGTIRPMNDITKTTKSIKQNIFFSQMTVFVAGIAITQAINDPDFNKACKYWNINPETARMCIKGVSLVGATYYTISVLKNNFPK